MLRKILLLTMWLLVLFASIITVSAWSGPPPAASGEPFSNAGAKPNAHAKGGAKPIAAATPSDVDPFGEATVPNPKPSADEARAIGEIEKLGGQVTVDKNRPGHPVISVVLSSDFYGVGAENVTDATLEHVKALPQLQSLNLRGSKVTDAGLEHLKGLTQLTDLDLSCTKVTSEGMQHLKGMTKLNKLDLGHTEVTDAGLENLKGLSQLQGLELEDTKVTGAGLEHLKGMTKLETLDLGNTEVTDAGLEHLKGLTKLTYLFLSSTKVTSEGMQHLKGLTQLETLDLGKTEVTDAGLEHLKGMTKLTNLDLSSTKVASKGMQHLKGLTQLKTLHLGHTGVTDAGLAHLKGMTQLEILDLDDTKVTGTGLKHLKGMRHLASLNLQGTKATDGVVDLMKALPNCHIDSQPTLAERGQGHKRPVTAEAGLGNEPAAKKPAPAPQPQRWTVLRAPRAPLPFLHVLTPEMAASPEPLAVIDASLSAAEQSAAAKINAALALPTSVDFVDTPLKDVIDYIKDLHKIEIRLDAACLKDAGVEPDNPVTINLKGISLRSALRLLLDEMQLKYVIHNEVLLITSPQKADSEEFMSTNLYPVKDLVLVRNGHREIETDFQPLIELITSSIVTKTWLDKGGDGTITAYQFQDRCLLVVKQTPEVQEAIAHLLLALRRGGVPGAKSGGKLRLPKRPKEVRPTYYIFPADSLPQSGFGGSVGVVGMMGLGGMGGGGMKGTGGMGDMGGGFFYVSPEKIAPATSSSPQSVAPPKVIPNDVLR